VTLNLVKHISYPIYYRPLNWMETFILHLGIIIKCPVCGRFSKIKNVKTDLLIREYCNCSNCNSKNRQRQIAYILTQRMGLSSLIELSEKSQAFIYNTEAHGVLHNILCKTKNYVCSEYLGSENKSGQVINGIRHEDLQALSFENDSFDVLISADVFEHVPNPYKAHKEVFRVLKSGGRHIFTVPFYQEKILDEKRAIINENNEIVFLKEPLYHSDPLSQKGILVYHVFSLEMLVRLAEIGFTTNLYLLNVPSAGIWGRNAVVFEALKK
jgi:SAM-dependent methyltransferase